MKFFVEPDQTVEEELEITILAGRPLQIFFKTFENRIIFLNGPSPYSPSLKWDLNRIAIFQEDHYFSFGHLRKKEVCNSDLLHA